MGFINEDGDKKNFFWFACDPDFINSQQMDEIASMPNRIGHSIIYLYLELATITLQTRNTDIEKSGYARLNIEPNPTALINFIKKRTGIAEDIIAIGLEELIRRKIIHVYYWTDSNDIEMYLPEVAKRQGKKKVSSLRVDKYRIEKGEKFDNYQFMEKWREEAEERLISVENNRNVISPPVEVLSADSQSEDIPESDFYGKAKNVFLFRSEYEELINSYKNADEIIERVSEMFVNREYTANYKQCCNLARGFGKKKGGNNG